MKKELPVLSVALLAGMVSFSDLRWKQAGAHHSGNGIAVDSLNHPVRRQSN